MAPEKGCDESTVCLLWGVGEYEVHVQGKAEVSVIDIELLLDWVSEAIKIIFLKLGADRSIPDLLDSSNCIFEVIEVYRNFLSISISGFPVPMPYPESPEAPGPSSSWSRSRSRSGAGWISGCDKGGWLLGGRSMEGEPGGGLDGELPRGGTGMS